MKGGQLCSGEAGVPLAWCMVVLARPALVAPLPHASYKHSAAVPAVTGVLEMTNGRELRALYGVCACAAQLGGGGKERGGSGSGRSGGAAAETAEDREAAAELGRLSAEALVQRYALLCPDKLPLVEGMLAAQGLLKRGGA